MPSTFVIIGASLTGATAAITLRQEGFDGDVVLVGAERHPPYERPPLSKQYLRGEMPFEKTLVRPAGFYAQNRITTLLATRATSIDTVAHTVQTDTGRQLRYDKLLIATGVRNRRRPIPGLELKGIYDLRSIADADALRAQIAPGRTAVVVGMGFIGSEVAASLRAQGLNVVTIHPSPAPLFRVLGEDIGRVLAAVHHDHGVDTIFNDVVTRFEGRGSVERAVTRDGRRIDCDLVVLGVGVEPVVDLARESGIDADDGILVDEYCRASADDVFAAGDVANHYHPLFQRRMRVEHWQNAIQQGAAAARSMLGHRVPYDAVHWFWSDQYDVNVQYAGVHGKWDQIVFRGAPATRSFLAFYLNGGRVDAIAGVNRGEDLRRALPLIRARSMVQPRQLADEDVDLRTLVRTETPDSHLSAARDSDH